MKRLNGLLKALEHAFFPYRCACCGEVIAQENEVCESCRMRLPFVTGPICNSCGHSMEQCTCGHCKRKFAGICAPFYYEGVVCTGLQRLKFHGDVRVAGFFGACMAQTVQTRFAGINFDWVTCVPLSRERRRERGYNQSERLAQVVASHLGLPMHADALTKIYHNEEQHRLNMQKRRANVLGVYEAKADVVQGKTILLVDDIATTGSTLEECAKVCMLEGAQAVYCVTAALVMLYQKESAVGNESVSEEHK